MFSGWVMRAFMTAMFMQEYGTAVQYLGSALSVLEWGLETWKDVPTDDRGAIFQPTFVRGIRRAYLDSYLGVSHWSQLLLHW